MVATAHLPSWMFDRMHPADALSCSLPTSFLGHHRARDQMVRKASRGPRREGRWQVSKVMPRPTARSCTSKCTQEAKPEASPQTAVQGTGPPFPQPHPGRHCSMIPALYLRAWTWPLNPSEPFSLGGCSPTRNQLNPRESALVRLRESKDLWVAWGQSPAWSPVLLIPKLSCICLLLLPTILQRQPWQVDRKSTTWRIRRPWGFWKPAKSFLSRPQHPQP